MQRRKSDQELRIATHLNIAEIARRFLVPMAVAKRYYQWANDLDNEQLGQYRAYPTKVRVTSVEKVSGINLQALDKRIKNAAAEQERTAING